MSEMADRIQRLLAAFEERGWDSEPWLEATAVALEAPAAVADLVRAFFPRRKSMTFLSAVLSFLPEEAWQGLVDEAVRILTTDPENELAEDVVDRAALQQPEALAPHLDVLFTVDEIFKSYAGIYAWRGAHELTVARLMRALDGPNQAAHPDARFRAEYTDTRMRAFNALLTTRRPSAVLAALERAPRLGLDAGERDRWLAERGYSLVGGALEALHTERPLHIVIPAEHMRAGPGHLMRASQPTWKAPAGTEPSGRLGGLGTATCGSCGQRAHHLLTLDPMPRGFGVAVAQ